MLSSLSVAAQAKQPLGYPRKSQHYPEEETTSIFVEPAQSTQDLKIVLTEDFFYKKI